jgi:hypothetical protein
MKQITRAYVRRYSDSGQITAYIEWSDGSRTEGNLHYHDHPHRRLIPTFGAHMHALFAAANRQGVRLEREVW